MNNLKVYVASSISPTNKNRVQSFMNDLRDLGCEISYDWTTHGIVDYDVLRQAACKEFAGALECDILIALMPGWRGTHFEMGAKYHQLYEQYGHANGKIIIVTGMDEAEHPTSFHELLGILKFNTDEEALYHIRDHYVTKQQNKHFHDS